MSFTFLIICTGGRNLSVFVVGNCFSLVWHREYLKAIRQAWRRQGETGKCGPWQSAFSIIPWWLHLLLIVHKYFLCLHRCLPFGTHSYSVSPPHPSYFVTTSLWYWEADFIEIITFLALCNLFPAQRWNNLKILTTIFNHEQK